ncbi:hypothetical protein DJ93_5617 [Bacillus clarus]|uniref:Uncharacterized protein n=1 Tax=Bacillus clarus TaxID=2338372 RepID=A0A090YB55_9BACI|nr:hypothetical protein DJ93_5617 [Bacillus clarus]
MKEHEKTKDEEINVFDLVDRQKEKKTLNLINN